MFLFGAPNLWSYKPMTIQENKLASGWTQSRTMHFHYCKYSTGIAPYCLNNIFMPSLNNYNTRSQMALDIPLCRTSKRQKSMSFLGTKIWNMLSWNIKAAPTTASFTHSPKKRNSWKIAIVSNFIDFVDSWFFFLQGNPNGNKNPFRSFLGHPCHLRSTSCCCCCFFCFFFTSHLAKYFSMSLTLPFFLFHFILFYFNFELDLWKGTGWSSWWVHF